MSCTGSTSITAKEKSSKTLEFMVVSVILYISIRTAASRNTPLVANLF